MGGRLYMETTTIAPNRTAGQIQDVLRRYGAHGVLTEYEGGEVSAVSFTIRVNQDQEVPFRLPCRWAQIYHLLRSRRRGVRKNSVLEAQAKRIAWRQILRWVEAQMAFIETGMVKMEEVFMPYIQVGIDKTLFDRLEEQRFKMIGYEGENG
jgi:hypothetical protein